MAIWFLPHHNPASLFPTIKLLTLTPTYFTFSVKSGSASTENKQVEQSNIHDIKFSFCT